ncbi:MAG TPA: hypothetical protein PKH43_00285 [Saprospiraceae bacterium]|nr:hypothetical protein [Saprospiraceae bacterium]
MQAISIAIGSAGIHFFAQQFLSEQITNLLKSLTPPDRNIPVDTFSYIDEVGGTWTITNLTIQLSQGVLNGYSPVYQGVEQGLVNGVALFTLNFPYSGMFTAAYAWQESYDWEDRGAIDVNGKDIPYDHKGNNSKNYSYNPAFSSLNVQVAVQFAFNTQNNAWEISVQTVTANAAASSPNIPKDSVLQNQSSGNCSFSTHVSDATTQAIDSIDFATPVASLISGILKTIPGSGNLGNGIVYDFSLGDGGIAFPNNDGIQIGVKGGANYKGTDFPGTPPPPLPLPTPPADSDEHHLNMYVSNYEVDALYWAFFQAGKLQRTVTPQDLSNPEALDVSTYVGWEPALQVYADKRDVMNAVITPNSAPVTSFQTVYIYGTSAMSLLQKQLPANIYAQIQNLASAPFLSQQDLENFLKKNQVPNQYFTTIESAGQTPGMVVTHDLNFNLVIQDTQYNNPYINFKVHRTDILTDLCLGLTDKAQTLQFGFYNAVNSATFIDSSVPNFNGGSDFGGPMWRATGESNYADCLKSLGKTGTPLPIMQGMQFDFTNAVLSIQENYVSILANVLYQNS